MRACLRFFLPNLVLRLAHALCSLPFHVDGDVAIPWLMANDWDKTAFHRYYWGQDYLGTPEILVAAKLGHALFGASRTIPLAFIAMIGQLEAAIGFTFVFAAVRSWRPGFGDRPLELAAAVGLLGFLPPALEKYTFGPGTGYTLAPLATGIALWLWSRECEKPISAHELAFWGAILTGLTSISRLNLIPALALAICLFASNARSAGEKTVSLLGFGLGGLLGLVPEAVIGFERSYHHSMVFTPIAEKWHHFTHALGQTEILLGTLPPVILSPRDALYPRGHAPVSQKPLEIVSAIVFLTLLWLTRKRLKERPGWVFAAIISISILLITLDRVDVDAAAARRYSEVLAAALPAWLLLNWKNKLASALTAFRLANLSLYFLVSIMYRSAYGDIASTLSGAGFDPALDCLSGSGGDLSTAMAFGEVVPRVLAWNWRLPECYSGALPVNDSQRAWSSCRQIFHIDSGEIPIAKTRAYCGRAETVFREKPLPAHRFREPFTIYRCAKPG